MPELAADHHQLLEERIMSTSTKRRRRIERAAGKALQGSGFGACPGAPVVQGSVITPPAPQPVPERRRILGLFDHVYVINLAGQAERMGRMAARLARIGVEFERFEAVAPDTAEPLPEAESMTRGHVAAARSHRAVLLDAQQRGFERVLVLEDDAVLRDDTPQWLAKMKPQLQALSWGVFYLGVHLVEDGGAISENLGRVGRGFHAHAYAFAREAIPKLLKVIDDALAMGFNYDCFEHPRLLRVYAKPILAVQEPNRSDVLGRYENRLGQYFPPFDREDFFAHCAEAREWSAPAEGPGISMLARKAKALHQQGKLKEAQEVYQQALAADGDDADALHFWGVLHNQQGNGAAALEMILRSVVLRPQSAEFYCNLGIVLAQAGRNEQAMEALDRAIALRADHAEAYDNRGLIFEKLGKMDAAIADWRQAIALQPQAYLPRLHLGNVLLREKKVEQAVEQLREAVRLRPRHAEAHNALGSALRKQGDISAAIVEFRKALQINGSFVEALNNLGTALSDVGRPQEGVLQLQKAVELKPDYADAHFNLSLGLLSCGEFDRGWLEYEWRELSHPDKFKQTLAHPRWNGASVNGRTVLLRCEQGLGDTLQFIRYAPMVAELGAKVIVECQPPLRELLRGVKGIGQIISAGDKYPPFDTHARLMSLPGMLRTLAKLEGVRLMSLQKNAGVEQIAAVKDRFTVEEFDPPLDEGTGAFMDTAAIMRQLDLVITSDTAIAHLAGALGVKVWVALPVNCDWRWLREREDSPWYPTMRLFRQPGGGDWAGVLARMVEALPGGPETGNSSQAIAVAHRR
jgi:tetratricopeptide (TPR) repeat protein